MSAGYKTSPVGIYTMSATDTATTATHDWTFIIPCDSTVLAITASALTHTSGTYGAQQGTLDILGTAGNRAFPSQGTAEIVKGSSLSNRKLLRGTVLHIIFKATYNQAQVTVILRPEKQVNLNPSDDA